MDFNLDNFLVFLTWAPLVTGIGMKAVGVYFLEDGSKKVSVNDLACKLVTCFIFPALSVRLWGVAGLIPCGMLILSLLIIYLMLGNGVAFVFAYERFKLVIMQDHMKVDEPTTDRPEKTAQILKFERRSRNDPRPF
jgi:hypothetical protein